MLPCYLIPYCFWHIVCVGMSRYADRHYTFFSWLIKWPTSVLLSRSKYKPWELPERAVGKVLETCKKSCTFAASI